MLLWACAFVCWICIEVIVRIIEEPYLKNLHGDDFLKYQSDTNRLHILADHEHPFWPMMNTDSGAS